MPLTRTIYADRDGLIAELIAERDASRRCAMLPDITRYRRHYWNGRVDGLDFAIALLRDWRGEDEPEHSQTTTASRTAGD